MFENLDVYRKSVDFADRVTQITGQFRINDKQAKRELSGLSRRGLIRFIRKPRSGYYVLCRKTGPKPRNDLLLID